MPRKATPKAVAKPAASQHVALYCRISKDRSGRVEGVRNQERWGRAYAAQRWPEVPISVYADNDLSAASDDVVRPEYERLREALRSGDVCAVWTVEQSRLERREVEWFRLAAELDGSGITEVHTNRDGIVRVHDEVAGIKAVLNAAEVRKLRRRVRDRLDENARLGIPSGNGPIYGYSRGVTDNGDKTLHVVDEEAAVIRDAADLVLAGWSLTSVCKEMTRRGVAGPRPGRDGPSAVSPSLVRRWLTGPTVAGWRVHQGEIIGRGNWPAIVDEETWQALRNALTGPRVVRTTDRTGEEAGEYVVRTMQRRPVRRYLLTGLVVCGRCGKPLAGAVRKVRKGPAVGTERPYYWCSATKGGSGCVSAPAEPIEEHVVGVLLTELDRPDFLAAVASDTHAPDRDRIGVELVAVDAQRVELAKMWGRRLMSADEWQAARAALQEDETRLRRELAALPAPMHRVDLGAVRAGWRAMTLEERREIVAMFIETVTVEPAPHKGAPFSVDRIAPPQTWWRRS